MTIDADLYLRSPVDDWMAGALCRGRDSVFVAEGEVGRGRGWLRAEAEEKLYAPALALCSVCPVREPCLHTGLNEGREHGIWGGTTPSQRRAMRRSREILEVSSTCSTRSLGS